MTSLLSVREVSKRFRAGKRMVDAVAGVSFELAEKETLAIVGESGSGKSTLARLVARLIEPTSGKIVFEDRELTALDRRAMMPVRKRLQIVFQDAQGALDPRMNIGEILEEPLVIHGLARGPERVRALLEMVDLEPELSARHPHELSGGQRQRIGIARALAVDPRLVVLDEPLSALDLVTASRILDLLQRLREALGLTYLFISHDLRAVRRFAGRVAVMHAGKFVEVADPEKLFGAPEHPHTKMLIAAMPGVDPSGHYAVSGGASPPAAPDGVDPSGRLG